ncbi:MAG: CBS domain-containing protein [Planctomycetota bacterium]|nr:MAG: CBS domain-containing protein [Planctomycetota bacterium]
MWMVRAQSCFVPGSLNGGKFMKRLLNDRPILAREIMTRTLVTLSPDLDVFQAIDILLKKRISGAPVVSADGKFLGIFSESSCMRFVINAAYDNLPDASILAFTDPNPPTITPETDLLTICQTFIDQATRRLPVLENGRLVGNISRRDVMRVIAEMAKGRQAGHAEPLYLSALLGGEDSEALKQKLAR